MFFLLGCILFGVGFVILAYVFHDIGADVKKRAKERELTIRRHS